MKFSLEEIKCPYCGCSDFEIIRVGRFLTKVKCLDLGCSNKKNNKIRVIYNFILRSAGILKSFN